MHVLQSIRMEIILILRHWPRLNVFWHLPRDERYDWTAAARKGGKILGWGFHEDRSTITIKATKILQQCCCQAVTADHLWNWNANRHFESCRWLNVLLSLDKTCNTHHLLSSKTLGEYFVSIVFKHLQRLLRHTIPVAKFCDISFVHSFRASSSAAWQEKF